VNAGRTAATVPPSTRRTTSQHPCERAGRPRSVAGPAHESHNRWPLPAPDGPLQLGVNMPPEPRHPRTRYGDTGTASGRPRRARHPRTSPRLARRPFPSLRRTAERYATCRTDLGRDAPLRRGRHGVAHSLTPAEPAVQRPTAHTPGRSLARRHQEALLHQ
jgi:hypothetical protein